VSEKIDPELLARIRANPDDPAAYAVLGDALTAKGDSWGELITMQHRLHTETNKRKRTALKTEADRIAYRIGPDLFGQRLASELAYRKPEWFCGFVAGATFGGFVSGDMLADHVRDLGASRAARALRRLKLVPEPSVDMDRQGRGFTRPFAEALAAIPNAGYPKTFKELVLGDEEHGIVTGHLEVEDFATALAKVPLESLVICAGNANPGKGGHPTLKRLALRLTAMSAGALEELAAGDWPALERLEVWTGECALSSINTSYEQVKKRGRRKVSSVTTRSIVKMPIDDHHGGLRWDEVSPATLEALVKPATVEVALRNLLFTDELAALLPKLDWLKRVRVLDLSDGTLSSAKPILDGKAAFARLEALVLDGNLLPEKDVAAIQKALPNARIGEQRTGSRVPAHLSRYVQSIE
jgi:hypothetical protein